MVCRAEVGGFVAGWGVLRVLLWVLVCRVRMRWWGRARTAWPKAVCLVSFALVVGLGDGVGAQGGGGGGEHGALEPLVAAVGDVLAPDGGARSSGHWCQAGVGGQVGSGVWGSLPRVWASKDGGRGP